MTVAELTVQPPSVSVSDDEVVLVVARSTPGGVELAADDPLHEPLAVLPELGFTGGADEFVRLPLPGGGVVAVVGLGSERSPAALRLAIGAGIRQLAGIARVRIAVPLVSDAELAAVLEGAALGSYVYVGEKAATLSGVKSPVLAVDVSAASDAAERLVHRATVLGDVVELTKDLVNAPPSTLYPQALANAAREAVSGLAIGVREWDETALDEDGFGGIAGVGRGSTRPPRLVRLEYAPAAARAHVALVGKGITFDTGGISLKPPVGMLGMKYDMAGAATVLAAVVAAARLELSVKVTAWMCIAENMPSGNALKPNDVLTIRGGRTVEVLNTDAEGRLVMADGIAAASEEHPDAIVDVATLTGAQMVALGTRYSAVMGEDGLVARLRSAAESAGELVWPMPLPEELRSSLNSDVADIANATPGNTAAGMLLAGVFLREFVGDRGGARIPWAHLDIAGPAQVKGAPHGYSGKGATAVTVPTLLRLLEDFSDSE